MDRGAETLCEMFVRERADVAGKVAVGTSDLVLCASDDDSPLRAATESQEELTRRIYRDDVTEIIACIETAAERNDPTETTARVQLSADEWCLFEFIIYPAGHFTADAGPIFTGRNVTHEHFATQRQEVVTSSRA